jgi:hypothetical protein
MNWDAATIIRIIVVAMLFAMLVWMLQSCKVQNCIPETIVRDSIVTEYKLDSIYLYEKDSIFIHEKADTVFINRFVTRYKDVMKIEHDTVYQDNKVVEVKEVLVEKPIAGVVKWFAWIGLAAVLIVVIKIGLKVYRKFVLHI